MSFESDIKKFSASLTKVIKDLRTKAVLNPVGLFTVDIIVKRVRQGYGAKNGSKIGLKPLSKSYIERRKRSHLSSFTSPGKSNLTFTGQLLYSLRAITSRNGIRLDFDESRSDGKRNSDIAKYVSKERPFLSLTRDEEKKVGAFFSKTFDELVKRNVK